jgi:hypothetical protein
MKVVVACFAALLGILSTPIFANDPINTIVGIKEYTQVTSVRESSNGIFRLVDGVYFGNQNVPIKNLNGSIAGFNDSFVTLTFDPGEVLTTEDVQIYKQSGFNYKIELVVDAVAANLWTYPTLPYPLGDVNGKLKIVFAPDCNPSSSILPRKRQEVKLDTNFKKYELSRNWDNFDFNDCTEPFKMFITVSAPKLQVNKISLRIFEIPNP